MPRIPHSIRLDPFTDHLLALLAHDGEVSENRVVIDAIRALAEGLIGRARLKKLKEKFQTPLDK